MRIKSIIFLVLGYCFQMSSFAQVYPVQGNAVLVPPYSIHLADYTTGTSDRLVMNVVLANQTRPELGVRLRIKIEGINIKIETKPEFIGPQIMLQGGIPLRLTGADLVEYFDPNNLNFSGISRREFEKTGALPQGFYQFCFEVLEYNRGVKISNTICAPGWLILNDPPLVNIPRNNEKLKPTIPQNVILQWTPRHTGSPNSAFMTEYELTMVEVWPGNRNPNDAILTSPPILQTTTKATSFIYGPAETPLEPDRRYAFRVRAKSIVGADEFDLFKNNGYSEVFTFVYGDACETPLNVSVSEVGAGSFRAKWDLKPNHSSFKVKVREANNPKAEWYSTNAVINETVINSLRSNTTYEYQVGGACGAFESQFTQIATVKTTETPLAEYSCGVPLDNFNLDPANLLPALNAGDIIQAGDFEVKVSKVTGNNGVFTGEGVIEVPFFNKAKVRLDFNSITVNKEMRMVSGHMNVTGAGVDVIPGGVLNTMQQLTEVLDQVDGALTTIEEMIPEAFDPHSFVADTALNLPNGINFVYTDPSDGTVIVTDKQGIQTRLPAGTSVSVTDASGNGFIVDKKGNVHQTTAAIAAKAGNREYNLILKFSDEPNAKFGFDEKKVDALASEYEQLKGGYFVPWKAIEAGKTDQVIASIQNSSIDKSKIKFEMGGSEVQAPPIGSSQTSVVTVTGKANDTVEDLIATYQPSEGGKQQVLGKVKVASYTMINKDVVIVPVNGTQFPGTVNDIATRVNEIYNQAVVNWNVTLVSPITVALDTEFDDGESGLLTNYTEDMKKVINAYLPNMVDEKFYMFIVNNPKSGVGALGYMPLSKNAGFIFADNHSGDVGKFATTIAHELGHGAFSLRHIFEEYPSLSQGETDNLMDYPSGSKLCKDQWDRIRHPEIILGIFEEDESAEAKTLFSSKYVYLHDQLSTKAWASTVKGDEFTEDIVTSIDSSLHILDSLKKKTYIYFNYVWFDATNISKFEEKIANQFRNARDHVSKKTGDFDFNLLVVVNAKYDAALNDGVKGVSFREQFYPMNGLDESCVNSVRTYLNDNTRKKFTNGLNAALVERGEKLLEKLSNCIVKIEERVTIALRFDNDDTRKYGRFTLPARATDLYVDCAEFVHDVLFEEGFTTIPSGDCIEQSKWYKQREESSLCATGTDVNSVKVGDILLWTGNWEDAKEYAHTGIVTGKTESYIKVTHAGQQGCNCDYGWKTQKIKDPDGNEVQKYQTMEECYTDCNYSINSTTSYYNATTLESKDHPFKYWARPKLTK